MPEADLEFNPVEENYQIQMEFEEQENGNWIFRIIDKGMGMTKDVILNYFLNVGASFRDDPIWREGFLDNEGNAKVLRSGRFGIGALTAFLLGK